MAGSGAAGAAAGGRASGGQASGGQASGGQASGGQALADAAGRWAIPTALLTPVVVILLLVVVPNSFFTFSAAALGAQVAIVVLHVATLALCLRARTLGRAPVLDGAALSALRRWYVVLVVATIAGLVTVVVHFSVVEHVSVAVPVAVLELGGPALTLAGLYRPLSATAPRP